MDGGLPFPGVSPSGAGEAARITGGTRSFLFLQGPISTFFDRLGRALLARGHHVQRINLHGGDSLFWRLPALDYRGSFADWRRFVAEVMDRERITHLIVHGDRRPYHLVAAEEARVRGIPVIATDLGYLRPDWITLEQDGMTSYSRFPRDPEAIRALAEEFADPDLGQRFHTPFWTIAGLDIAYNLGLVFGRPFYPNYRYHSIVHPFAEYAGWLKSRARDRFKASAATAAKQRLQNAPGSYFLVPLQLATDYQIRAHSPYDDIRDAVREIVASFAASGIARELVFVAHPLDNGLIDWDSFIGGLAVEYGVADRIVVLGGGTPSPLLCNTAGMVTINSTIGITALQNGVPVKVLGNAVFNIAGLTCQTTLDEFWHAPPPPDAELMAAFTRALAGVTQVKGGYYRRESQDAAIAGFIERFEQGLYPLEPLNEIEFAGRPPRPATRTVVIAGADGPLGLALARIYAAPGVQLLLLGLRPAALARAAQDCRQRGALAECFVGSHALAEHLAELDRVAPVETLVINAEAIVEPTLAQAIDGDIIRANSTMDVLAAAMRERRQGHIVLVDRLVAQPAISAGDPEVMRAHKAWRAYVAGLRHRCRAEGITVACVSAGRAALRLSALLDQPQLAWVTADRVADKLQRRRSRQGHTTVSAVGVRRATMRAAWLLPGKLRRSARDMILSVEDSIPERVDEAPLAGKSGNAD